MTQRMRLKQFCHDVPAGTVGEVVKKWKDQHGNRMVRLYFGRNQTGRRMSCSFPADVLEEVSE